MFRFNYLFCPIERPSFLFINTSCWRLVRCTGLCVHDGLFVSFKTKKCSLCIVIINKLILYLILIYREFRSDQIIIKYMIQPIKTITKTKDMFPETLRFPTQQGSSLEQFYQQY